MLLQRYRPSGAAIRAWWLSTHLAWVGALFVSVRAGRLYSGACDDMFSNGDNGPFGYGSHSDLFRLALLLLLYGLIAAVALCRVSWDRGWLPLDVLNVVIGTAGAAFTVGDLVTQIERNPYCTSAGMRSTIITAAVILSLALLVNSGLVKRSKREPMEDPPFPRGIGF
ncbi:MAG TPA: hypothetical protein PLV13_08480 [Ilumatobacteraceae bacterium]|nr:hypothetical protein [Ilumatobacteraceae bacterium]